MRILNEDNVIKALDRHTNEDGTLDDDISCILEEVPDIHSNIVIWVSVEERLPAVVKTESYPTILCSIPVLVQTKKGDMFVAIRQLTIWESRAYKDEDNWYSYGTGGRKMKVMGKVVAWMPLPEPYTE